ncbi:ABC transporter permease subunit [Bacillus hwajinpoensis]|uniref:Nickel import system permease protein NikB n=1 Tax=Guptibacillus hwajinpoensis TaxID=208199 RepID=A0A845F0C7_9BACL|nr:nickel ABC transporter permease [Pseudalkalibacillus hwajinpoensis]MYL64402.1 ABC transporter permease subunit [Pseudalkalibacillus hwajinpoensis]
MKSVIRRLLELIIFLMFLSFVSFSFIKLAPGDPAMGMMKTDEVAVTEEQLNQLRVELGFNEPIYVQYWNWMLGFFQFDFGHSYMTKQPVGEELFGRLPATLELTVASLMIMVVIAFPLGSLAAIYRNTWIDEASRLFALLGASIPSFWLGLLFINLFAVQLNLFPSMGMGTWKHLFLPALTLGLAMAAVYVRILRSSLLDSFGQEFIRAAKARGLSRSRVFFYHAFRHSLLPVLTIFGVSLGSLLGGTVIIEVLFAYPGVGKLVVDAIMKRDYPIIQGYIFLMGILIMLINLAVDASYYIVHPELRVREARQR